MGKSRKPGTQDLQVTSFSEKEWSFGSTSMDLSLSFSLAYSRAGAKVIRSEVRDSEKLRPNRTGL